MLEKKDLNKSRKWLSVKCVFREQSVTYRSIGFNEPSDQSYRGLGTGHRKDSNAGLGCHKNTSTR